MKYSKRNIEPQLKELVKTRPLVYLNGARQTGKSTVCSFISDNADYITFDSPLVSEAAKSNPEIFVNSLPENRLTVIDEIQSAPEIFPYLKMKIDKNRLEGKEQRFLLTGSANLMALPSLSEYLAGRMSIITLYPFSAAEFYGAEKSAAVKLLKEEFKIAEFKTDFDLTEVITNASFPEIALNKDIDRINWFDSYLSSLLNRDIKSLSDLKNPNLMIRLLSILSSRTGGLLNNTEIANETGADYRTYEKMLAFAINSFMVFFVKPWSKPDKFNKRFVKSPKLYFTDCSFLSYIMKRSIKTIYETDKQTFGHIFENFAASELIKSAKLCNAELYHYRTHAGRETDFVLEDEEGGITGIEVKASGCIDKKQLKGLIELKEICADNFKRGIVLYTGKDMLPLDDKIWAVPVQFLWK